MKRLFKSMPFLNAFVPEIKNEGLEIYQYGRNNLLPNEWIKAIMDSGVARICISKVKSYIAAYGFLEEGDMRVNEKQTADQLLRELSGYVSYFNGFALHISRTGGGGKIIRCVPFQCVRKRLDGLYEVNLTYGQPQYKRDASKVYAPYGGEKLPTIDAKGNPIKPEVLANGEIFYVYLPTPDNQQYPVPDYYAGIEDIKASAELSKFDLESIRNGFIPSAVLTIIGDVDDQTKDDSGRTEKDYLNIELDKFTGKTRDADGLSGRNNLFVQTAATKDEAPVLQPFDSKAIFEAAISKRESIDRAVCRLFKVHPVLAGFSDAAVLGNQQAMSNASQELNKSVDDVKLMIEEAFNILFPNIEWKISEYTPVQFVPDALLPVMTEDEKRMKLLGLPAIERQLPTEQEKILTTLNGLSPLLASEIVRNMPKKELLSLVGIDYVEPEIIPDATEQV